MIYLDYNATTPLAPEVAEAMAAVLTEPFGNPSSDHALGRASRAVIDTARGRVASAHDPASRRAAQSQSQENGGNPGQFLTNVPL